MSIQLRFNADAAATNAIQLGKNILKEKGVAAVAVNNYDTGNITVSGIAGDTLTSVTIGGQAYAFGTPVSVATISNLQEQLAVKAALKTQLDAAIAAHKTYLEGLTPKQSLINNGGMVLDVDATNIRIRVNESQVVFNSITDGTTATNFTATLIED